MPSEVEGLKVEFLQENPEFQTQAYYDADEERWCLELPAFKEFAIWCASKGHIPFEKALRLNIDLDRFVREMTPGSEGPPVI